MWTYQEEALAGAFDVVCPDLPGFGLSSGLAGPYDLARFAASVSRLIDELGVDEVDVAGFAFGAAVAMATVAGGDKRVRRLALVAPPSAATAPYDKMPRAMRRDWPRFAQASADTIVKQPHSADTLRWLGDTFRATPLAVALATVALLAEFEPVDAARDVDVPTLLIHGEDDDVVPVSVSEQCLALLDKGELARVTDCGHLVPIDQKEKTSTLLSEFFAR